MGPELLMSGNALREIVLASGSLSRARLLRDCGITPTIIISGVDEEDPTLTCLPPKEMVITLAILKAHAVRPLVGNNQLIIGCDSTLEFQGESLGKPLTVENAVSRSKALQGNVGLLHTGHCIIDTKNKIEYSDISTSQVFFAEMTDLEIELYAQSGEPLTVAGGFTLDGLSAPFIERIEGDPSGIIGLSLPLLRRAIISLGLKWSDVAEMVVPT